MNKSGSTAKQSRARNRKPIQSEAEALKVMKASGILNPDVTLDQIMKLSEQLNLIDVNLSWIFKHFLYKPCKKS